MEGGGKFSARQQLRLRTAVAGLPATDRALEIEPGLPSSFVSKPAV